jgi:amino-acid N-acetyltransferase
MQELINSFADNGELLPRSLNMLYEDLRDFILVEEEGRIVGTCALHINWEDLAEIKALTIAIPLQGKGLGRQVVEACLDEARVLGVTRVFALTYQPEFFKRIGFHEIEKAELPHKVWNECINCVKFPNCGEVAVIRSVD